MLGLRSCCGCCAWLCRRVTWGRMYVVFGDRAPCAEVRLAWQLPHASWPSVCSSVARAAQCGKGPRRNMGCNGGPNGCLWLGGGLSPPPLGCNKHFSW